MSNRNKQGDQNEIQQTPIPQTIILESNRLTSRQDDTLAESYNTNHRWTTEYSNGGVQIKKGDEIRINSAYISSIGVGDLIEWDVREDSETQDNKSNWLFSYYGCNDHLNDKRSGYNIKEVHDGANINYGGHGRFNFDCDNSPCPLMRVTKSLELGTTTDYVEFNAERLSWLQDPYLKCRFFGETFTIKTPVLDDHFQFTLHPKIPITITGDNLQFVTGIQVEQYTSNNTFTTIDPRRIMGIGQTLHFQSQQEPFITANPNTNFHDKNVNDWVFTIQDFRVAVTATGVPAGTILIVVDSLNDLTGINFSQTESITNTAKVLIGNLPSICSSGETAGNYQHTPLSTIIWSGNSSTGAISDNYTEVGDKFKQYIFYGISFNNLDVTQFNLMSQLKDSQTANKVVEVQVASSQQTEAETKIAIHMISLKDLTGAGDRQKQQIIKFQFPVSDDTNSNYQKMKNSGADSLKVFTEILGTNCIVFDFHGSNTISGREIAVCFIYTQSNGYSNFFYDTTTDIIQVNNVRRNQNNQDLKDVLTLHQPITTNTIIDNTKDYYLIKTSNFFTDLTATFIDEQDQQFRADTWDWGDKVGLAINSNNRIGYLGYVKDNNNELTQDNLTILNNRSLLHHELQSNSFNIQNPADNTMVNRPIKYAGYIQYDTDNIRVKHYAQHELKIDENYSSPSDIATALTDQTHFVGNAIDKNGQEIPNSQNSGIIQNVYYIPVWSSAGSLTDKNVTGDVPDQNKEDVSTGKLTGKLQNNSFLLKYKMKNSAKAFYSSDSDPVFAGDGEYDIYFKTLNTFINKPVAFQDPNKQSLVTNGKETGGNKFSLTADLDQTRTSENVGIAVANQQLQQAKTFSSVGTSEADIIGFPIEYAPDSHISQYCGSNNISISWDDTSSRFKIDFLHMSATSKFLPSEEGVVQEGGSLSATIYYPAPRGRHNNLYKMPRTRCGGVNIENWTSQDFSNITTPQQVRTLCNLDSTIDLSTEWFVCDHNNISPNTPELQQNYDSIGNKFWNKLGFLNSQLYKDQVGSLYDNSIDRYIPKGTTDNLVDIADATITAEEPAENTPFFFTKEKFDGSASEDATYQFSSIGALNFNSHLSGYGLPNTSGVPLTFRSNETLANLNIDIVTSKGDTQVSRPAFSPYLSTYNPDREMVNGYSFTTEPDSMTAKSLPIKTEFPYFYVMSDLIDTDFNISANKGSGLNCLGVISKLNAEGDFFFQYQAPQSFFATKDKLISSVTTELRTPTLGIPQALSPYSSIIYQITRYAPTPIKVSPPAWLEQKMVFDQMKNLLEDIATSLAPPIPISADQQISDGIGGQVAVSIPNAPIENLPIDEREIYQSMIDDISIKITEPTKETQEFLRTYKGGPLIQQTPETLDKDYRQFLDDQTLDFSNPLSQQNLIRFTNEQRLGKPETNSDISSILGSGSGYSMDANDWLEAELVRLGKGGVPSELGQTAPSTAPTSFKSRGITLEQARQPPPNSREGSVYSGKPPSSGAVGAGEPPPDYPFSNIENMIKEERKEEEENE